MQNSGGHTRVILDFIEQLGNEKIVVLITGIMGQSDLSFIKSSINKKIDVSFFEAPKGDFAGKLTWLQKTLVETNIRKVYLFNHHQDSVAVSSIVREMDINTYFYHHGDHHFSLGVYIDYFVHIDFHPMGYHHCRAQLGINNIYIPLSVTDKKKAPLKKFFSKKHNLVTCTAAGANKIEHLYYVNYLEVIPSLLSDVGGKHVHIGRLTPWALLKIRYKLYQLKVPFDRFVYIPWVADVWGTLIKNDVDLYLASFPYGGGRTLVEAMGAGVPVVLHKHMYSQILSCKELAYEEAFSWEYPVELIEYCKKIDPDTLQKHSIISRNHYEINYDGRNLKSLLYNDSKCVLLGVTSSPKFKKNEEEWAVWILRNITLQNILRKKIYNILRWIKRLIL